MTVHGQSAVLVLAAGAGTRMRSDTPKVLHTLAGRSMLSHALHSVAKVAPQHLVVVLGHERDRITPAVSELAETLGRPIDVAVQEQQLGTGHAVDCGLAALPADFAGTVVVTSGDVPLLDADTLAELIATHSAETAAATVLTTTLPDPTGYGRILRTQDREVIGIVEEVDATRVATGHRRGQRRRLRLRHRRRCARRWTGCSPTTPSRSSTSPTSSRSSGRTARSCGPSMSTTPRWWPASTTGSSWPSWPPN